MRRAIYEWGGWLSAFASVLCGGYWLTSLCTSAVVVDPTFDVEPSDFKFSSADGYFSLMYWPNGGHTVEIAVSMPLLALVLALMAALFFWRLRAIMPKSTLENAIDA
jgi:hypothetical protein